jgi:hypothetical protein
MPELALRTSTRFMPRNPSSCRVMAPCAGLKKLGQPVPLLNLVSLRNRGARCDRVDEPAGPLLVQMGAGEGALGALFEGDLALFRGEQPVSQPFPEAGLVAAVAGVA